ncbi:hypothetical protein FRB91_002981 [Serendipita sp. 411]|nr:hypothetical protein FRB91_002981 [Serendipita sp. 411]
MDRRDAKTVARSRKLLISVWMSYRINPPSPSFLQLGDTLLLMVLPRLNTLLFLVFVFHLSFGSAAVHSVPHNDPRISYLPSVCDLDCSRVCRNQWWLSCLSDGSASHRTKGNETSSNFSFRGSSVTWFTRRFPQGGKAVVYIDATDAQLVDTSSPITVESYAIFTKSGLDATRDHMISIVYDTSSFVSNDDRFVDIHHFEYDDAGSVAAASSASSSGQPASSTQTGSSIVSGTNSAGSTATTGRNASIQASGSAGASQPGSLESLVLSLGSPSESASPGGTDSVNVASHNGNNSQKLGPGSIIGVVFGGLGFLLVTAIFLWYARQRKRKFSSDYGTNQSFKHREIPELDNDKDGSSYGRERDIELNARGTARHNRNFAYPDQPPSQSHLFAEDHPQSVIDIAMSSRETLPAPLPQHPSTPHESSDREESEIEVNSIIESEPVPRREPTPQTFEGARSRKMQMMNNGSRTALPSRPRSPNTDYSGSGTRMSTGDQLSPMEDFASLHSRSGRYVNRRSLAVQSSIRGETPPPSYVQ